MGSERLNSQNPIQKQEWGKHSIFKMTATGVQDSQNTSSGVKEEVMQKSGRHKSVPTFFEMSQCNQTWMMT